jgi:hypothetical protein
MCFQFKSSKDNSIVKVSNSITEIDLDEWNSINKNKNLYLCPEYLEAIESSLNSDIDFKYLSFYTTEHEIEAIAVVQILPFQDKGVKDQAQLCHVRSALKTRFINTFQTNIITCGSPFSCGENGFAYSDKLSPDEAYKKLGVALLELQKNSDNKIDAPVILIKEIWPENFNYSLGLKSSKFRAFEADVNMVMKIPPQWVIFNDYLASMVTKFRTKAKSAFKKSDALSIVNLETEDILQHKETIEKLYINVVEKSPFTFGKLNGESFYNLKSKLGDAFIIKGYFLEKTLVGFSSSFICNNILEANYIGIDYSFNNEYAIYQRMLYDYVDMAIEYKCEELRFGRTAEEIKSTIGAVPVNMKLYVRHKSDIINKVLKSIFESIQPSSFELRKPFKAEVYDLA